MKIGNHVVNGATLALPINSDLTGVIYIFTASWMAKTLYKEMHPSGPEY